MSHVQFAEFSPDNLEIRQKIAPLAVEYYPAAEQGLEENVAIGLLAAIDVLFKKDFEKATPGPASNDRAVELLREPSPPLAKMGTAMARILSAESCLVIKGTFGQVYNARTLFGDKIAVASHVTTKKTELGSHWDNKIVDVSMGGRGKVLLKIENFDTSGRTVVQPADLQAEYENLRVAGVMGDLPHMRVCDVQPKTIKELFFLSQRDSSRPGKGQPDAEQPNALRLSGLTEYVTQAADDYGLTFRPFQAVAQPHAAFTRAFLVPEAPGIGLELVVTGGFSKAAKGSAIMMFDPDTEEVIPRSEKDGQPVALSSILFSVFGVAAFGANPHELRDFDMQHPMPPERVGELNLIVEGIRRTLLS